MVELHLDTKEFWECLTMQGKAKALMKIECTPRLATISFDKLPRMVRERLDRMWNEHPRIELNPTIAKAEGKS